MSERTGNAESFYGEIIACLENQEWTSDRVNLRPDILKDFYTDRNQPQEIPPVRRNPVPQRFVPQQNPAPAVPQQGRGVPAGNLSWEELIRTVSCCTGCKLAATRHKTVFGAGNPHAELMFLGEAPGADEDMQGQPFVGKAGQLLTKMIQAMQFTREEVFIANTVKCRPPGNRNPEPDETEACRPYIMRQIELVHPKVIVSLGAVPMRLLFPEIHGGITAMRGKWMEFRGIRVMPTFHPAYLLYNESAKRVVWQDLQLVMAVFGKKYVRRQPAQN